MNRPEKDDYPELTGKEIEMILCDTYFDGIVQGVNFDIGISIAMKGDPTNYLFCMPGPATQGFKNNESSEVYESVFNSIVSELREGIYTGEWKKFLPDRYFPDGSTKVKPTSMSTCPWS